MGKRRERRMAAMSAAGRRVKLDLFAEPSGGLGGSSAQDELEGGLDSKRSDGLPNSPSSSGQQPENPLLLLGQYSDDDEDNRSTKSHDHANDDTSLGNHIDQADASLISGCTDLNVCMDADLSQTVKKDAVQDSSPLKDSPKLDGSDSGDKETSISGDFGKEIDARQQNHVGGAFDAQVVGDVSSGWKMVLHEETNRYYYWNVETGETSWEVPEVLAQLAAPISDPTYAAVSGEKMGSLPLDTLDLNSSSNYIIEGGVTAGLNHNGSSSGHLVSQSKSLGEFCAPGNGPIEGFEGNLPRDLPWGEDVSQQPVVSMQDSMVFGKCESGIDYWSPIIKFGESLLQRLNSLESSVNLPCDRDWISKCVLEVEIRLTDMKSLSSHGSSLHPFWVLSEEQLRRLESVVDSKVGHLGKFKLKNDTTEANLFVATEDSGSHRSVKEESKAGHTRSEVLSPAELTLSSPRVDALTEAAATVPREDIALFPNGSNVCSGEDIDMDVDMEVDDATSEGHTAVVEKLGGDMAASDNTARQEEPVEPPTLASGGGSPIPPPPDEEWIPPPPPDSEQIPPPPPDEPEPLYPLPPLAEVGQPLPFTDQYSLSYPNSSYEIYGHSEVSSGNFYGHVEGQVVVPQGPVLYGGVLNTYAETTSVMSNVEPVAYYNIQNGTEPSIGVAAAGSTQYEIQSAPLSYGSLASSQLGADHSNLLSQSCVEPSDARGKTGNGFSEVTSTSASMSSAAVEAPATTLGTNGISEPSASTAAATGTTLADAKVQSKALRSKKRTVASVPSLRSNKKVASLVDKWKAAKEELEEEEEDEAKAALAALERKRQKEIEEWHAQQIASGEARENANFQPLGGDWRERVKRKRAQAQANKETASATEEPTKGNQQPDLGDLSKDLPLGWQAYWDESSKQVYYGNTLTSETTWIRPTK